MANSHIVLLWETAHHRVKCTTVLYCFSFALPKVILESYGTPKKIEVKNFQNGSLTDISADKQF